MTTWMDPTGADDSVLEAELRLLLNERADGIPPETTPYDTILSKGRAARRRRTVALCAGAAVLAAAGPAAAIGLQSGGASSPPPAAVGSPADTPTDSPAETPTETPTETGSEGPGGPSDPERQLLDGVTLEQAAASLERCLAEYAPQEDVDDLRILLAWVAQGDENRGEGPFRQVLAVTDDREAADPMQFVCSEGPDGRGGMQSGPRPTFDNDLPVYPDINAGRYFAPMMGTWELPFRWADFGVVQPDVERVTVTHAGVTEEAVLEEGYFVVAGTAEEQPDANPVVLGYDADGAIVYDSREDPTYQQIP